MGLCSWALHWAGDQKLTTPVGVYAGEQKMYGPMWLGLTLGRGLQTYHIHQCLHYPMDYKHAVSVGVYIGILTT